MVDATAAGPVPNGIGTARSCLAAALQLLGNTKYRKKQLEVLTRRCDDAVQQYMSYIENHPPEVFADAEDGSKEVEESCESVKNILENVNEKGFLWCLMNSDKLDKQISECEEKLEIAFLELHKLAQRERLQQLTRARDGDRDELSSSLATLSQNESSMLEAIQDQSGVYRSSDELIVAVLKHVQKTTDDSTPETIFLKSAAGLLSRKHNISKDSIVSSFVMSSVEVEFDVDSPIGHGASGVVYEGEWNGAPVAVKRIHVDDARMITEEQRKLFRHEVKTWSMLHHPNILTFYGACLTTPVPFLVMKYCQFGSINNYLLKFPEANRTMLSREIALGLAFLHRQDIVHADVKSANVLISDDHHALLADFGLALKLFQIRSQSAFSADLNRRRGTLLWMAPEVLSGNKVPDKAADVYSLGLTIWEVFSGDIPFKNFISPELLIDGVVNRGRRPERPGMLVDDHVWDVVQKCWQADPSARPKANDVQVSLKTLKSSASSLSMNVRPISRTVSDSGLFVSDGTLNAPSTVFTSTSSTTANDSLMLSSHKNGQSSTYDPGLFESAPGNSMDRPRGRGPHEQMHREKSLPSRLSSGGSSDDDSDEEPPILTVTSPTGFPSAISVMPLEMPESELPYTPSVQQDKRSKSRAASREPSRDRRTAEPVTTSTNEVPAPYREKKRKGRQPKVEVSQDSDAMGRESPLPFTDSQSLLPDSNSTPRRDARDRSRSQQRDSEPTTKRQPRSSRRPKAEVANTPDAPSEPTLPFHVASTLSYNPSREQNKRTAYPWGLDKFFGITGLMRSFGSTFDERYLSALIEKATDMTKMHDRPLGVPGLIERLVRLAMYQVVIYCDDSSSMEDGGLFDMQGDVVEKMAQIPGQLRFRNNNVPVEVRFINSSVAIRAYKDKDVRDAWRHVRPRGGNKIGTGLRTKILDPFIFDALRQNRRLDRPLLVNVFTDYCPDAEARDTFKEAIVECKQMLHIRGYRPTHVLFTISSVTNDQSARQFLDELQSDPKISDVVCCTSDRLKFKYNKVQSSDDELHRWLLQSMTTPIVRLEG
ncbi:hypothetical protein EIP86_001032 [Pleurotus ostreatoroseus]|nr:hypothetical protein EIP86_001032 [Pleurotus ostreatoroseus]